MHANEYNKMFIIHTRVASCLFPREVPSNSPFECKVTEGVSRHAADFLLFSKRATGPSYGKFIHMPHLPALRGCSLVSSTAAEKKKVGGVSGNPLRYLIDSN